MFNAINRISSKIVNPTGINTISRAVGSVSGIFSSTTIQQPSNIQSVAIKPRSFSNRQLSPQFKTFLPSAIYKREFSDKPYNKPSYTFTTPKKNLYDLGGSEEVLDKASDIVRYFQDPQIFEELGIKPPNGMIISGPPGVGKSFLAEAIAGHAGVRFILISGSEVKGSYVGQSEENLRTLFKEAEKNAPCIICIDEIDSIGMKRFSPNSSDHTGSLTNQLLTLLAQDHPGVVVIGTTNNVKSLDPALIRPGRFDRSIVMSLPDKDEREKILEIYIKDKKLAKDVVVVDLAACSRGFSGAKLAAWVNEAAISALREGSKIIAANNFNEARLLVSCGVIGSSSKNPKQKKDTAIHEAGHALVAHLLGQEVYTICIQKTATGLGFTEILGQDDASHTQQDLLDLICIKLGGRASEKVFKCVQAGSSQDMNQAKEILSLMKQEGMIPNNEQIVEQILTEQMTRAVNLLENNKDKLDNIIKSLIEYGVLNKDQFLLSLEDQISTSQKITRVVKALPPLGKPQLVKKPKPINTPNTTKASTHNPLLTAEQIAKALNIPSSALIKINTEKGCLISVDYSFNLEEHKENIEDLLDENSITYIIDIKEKFIGIFPSTSDDDNIKRFSDFISGVSIPNSTGITKKQITKAFGIPRSEINYIKKTEGSILIQINKSFNLQKNKKYIEDLLNNNNVEHVINLEHAFIAILPNTFKPDNIKKFNAFINETSIPVSTHSSPLTTNQVAKAFGIQSSLIKFMKKPTAEAGGYVILFRSSFDPDQDHEFIEKKLRQNNVKSTWFDNNSVLAITKSQTESFENFIKKFS